MCVIHATFKLNASYERKRKSIMYIYVLKVVSKVPKELNLTAAAAAANIFPWDSSIAFACELVQDFSKLFRTILFYPHSIPCVSNFLLYPFRIYLRWILQAPLDEQFCFSCGRMRLHFFDGIERKFQREKWFLWAFHQKNFFNQSMPCHAKKKQR